MRERRGTVPKLLECNERGNGLKNPHLLGRKWQIKILDVMGKQKRKTKRGNKGKKGSATDQNQAVLAVLKGVNCPVTVTHKPKRGTS